MLDQAYRGRPSTVRVLVLDFHISTESSMNRGPLSLVRYRDSGNVIVLWNTGLVFFFVFAQFRIEIWSLAKAMMVL